MIKKAFIYFSLFICISLCTSCFEILEEITLNKDGSGTVMVTLNMSKSKTKLASLMLLDSINGYKIPSEDEIDESFKDILYHLEKTPGISNIKKTKDFDNYIFTISCDFKNVDNVNAIFKELIKKQNKNNYTNFTTTNLSYNPSENVFNRHFTYDDAIKKSFNTLKNEDRKVFDNASYTCIYRFQDKVKSVSNTNAKIAPNKGAVFLKIDALSLILGEKNVENKIQLIN
ncbi:hypothetical protein CLV91_0952 [Maribacter vaceletii]|uniref:Uncharacterized protein n=2 Tax=Maribacter vaceletii TaxID=1206816 RepID=A0A495EDZ0_9FLAO|nr:hypothetical protein CLV91_0952 [Maribacter vaceletii]